MSNKLNEHIAAAWQAIHHIELQADKVQEQLVELTECLDALKIAQGQLISAIDPAEGETEREAIQAEAEPAAEPEPETLEACINCEFHKTGTTKTGEVFSNHVSTHHCMKWNKPIPPERVKTVKCDEFTPIDYKDDIPF